MKKILVSMLTLAAVFVVIPMFAAFEAHVINVTARIENALKVPLDSLNFGTVFPQEQLEKELGIWLSGSFLLENRVDDVEYIIRQKPKCAVTNEAGTAITGQTWTGHVIPDNSTQGYYIDCEQDRPEEVAAQPNDLDFYLLPSLCEYISKHPDNLRENGGNDDSLDSFHKPFWINEDGEIDWNDVKGHLAKSDDDTNDTWTIDLAVPCFGGFCAQDWAQFVANNDGDNNANPNDYTQPIENEHKVFGCNLWVEVESVSEATTTPPAPDNT